MEKETRKLDLRLGVHVSISGSLDRSVDRALEIGCTTFQIFTRNPRGWKCKDLDRAVVELFKGKVSVSGMAPIFAHMPYIPNLASPDSELYSKSVGVLVSEMRRCEQLGIPYLVAHLGSHRGSGIGVGIKRVVEACRAALKASRGDAAILLENTAGTRNSVGGSLEDIASVLDGLDWNDNVGLCFDTCHAFASGYELRSVDGLKETLERLDQTIGASRLGLVHLNDSKKGLSSSLDRHEHIGLGRIGEDGFRRILGNKLIRATPLILETPVDLRRDDFSNLSKVRSLAIECELQRCVRVEGHKTETKSSLSRTRGCEKSSPVSKGV